jgi:hypothetical protein
MFVTCGCYACEFGDVDGYGLAAMLNPGGPAAVIGSSGESYAAAGQLAFQGLLHCLEGPQLPQRLGECWLELKKGLADGPMDLLTFTMFDYADGSRGKTPLALQRLEHLEMWMLLGDPAMRMPQVAMDVLLEVSAAAEPGAMLTVRGQLSAELGHARVHLSLERPAGSVPIDLESVPAAPPNARARVMLANHEKANRFELLTQDVQASAGRFECQMKLPAKLPWPQVIVKASAVQDGPESLGVGKITVRHPSR